MSSELLFHKRQLRQKLRAMLKTMCAAPNPADSLRACDLLRQQSVWKNARSVLFYTPLPGELDLTSLHFEAVTQGKIIALPRFIEARGEYDAFQIHNAAQDCIPGKFGIREPAAHCAPLPLMHLDLIMTPGVGFDLTGHRLGRGQGYYDRLLARAKGVKCGVAFDQQIMEHIPGETHDVPMNCILTPTRWLEMAG
ncbi:MAG TPA: 5-formyltetrahydrofolate cyclo-ligase [Candidatus Saccharimonadales bacterium]|nr:5-formyltetrahydrofolate cyclo-ligase [Candidatus Saccharimonadales bacterium]